MGLKEGFLLSVITELNTQLIFTHHEPDHLIDKGDTYSECQSYEVIDLNTGQTVYDHCNLPAALKSQAM